MRAKHFCFVLTTISNLRRRFGTSKMHLIPLSGLGDVRYKAEVLLLLIHC